jgi:hypothetical protein
VGGRKRLLLWGRMRDNSVLAAGCRLRADPGAELPGSLADGVFRR